MATIKLEVEKDGNGTTTLMKNNKAVTTVTIKKDQNMEIDIGSGFGAGAEVTSFTLYQETNGAKGAVVGTWNRTAPTTAPSTEVAVTATGTGAILVTDTDAEIDEVLYFFSVRVTDNGQTYDTDPELKVKKTTG